MFRQEAEKFRGGYWMMLKFLRERVLLLLDFLVATRMEPGLINGASLRVNSSGIRMLDRMAATALPCGKRRPFGHRC